MRRRALLVGINTYPNPAHELRGCLNDVAQVAELLSRHFDFNDERQIRFLRDDQATTNAIRAGLAWLVEGAAAGDALVFHYSGHGSQVRDREGDEADGLDETLCPYDFDWDHAFTDDELGRCLAGVPSGAQLTVILDCCHSGTGLRETPASRLARVRCIAPPPTGLSPARSRAVAVLPRARLGDRAASAGAILLAACRSDQVSADAYLDGSFHGAATYFLCQAVADTAYRASYEQVVVRARQLLREHQFDQVPQVEGPPALRRAHVFCAPQPATVAKRPSMLPA